MLLGNSVRYLGVLCEVKLREKGGRKGKSWERSWERRWERREERGVKGRQEKGRQEKERWENRTEEFPLGVGRDSGMGDWVGVEMVQTEKVAWMDSMEGMDRVARVVEAGVRDLCGKADVMAAGKPDVEKVGKAEQVGKSVTLEVP